jgi:hypothetical protein
MGAFLPKLGLAAIAALAISGSANAAVSISGYQSGSANLAVPSGEQLVEDFEGGPAATGFTFSGGTLFSGTMPLVHQAPAGDLSEYVAVLGGQTAAVLTTPTTITTLSMYIGSVDSFNSISFYNSTSSTVPFQTITGSALREFASGGPDISVADGRFFFNLTNQNVDKISFGSTSNSFELDNIAASVPEPGVWAMMMLGLGGLGYALRRRRFAVSAAATA